MSVFGIASNYLFNNNNQGLQIGAKQPQQAFLQLGQDIQSGNLSAAQSDLATLEQLMPQYVSTASTPSNNSITNAFNQLSQDLQAGNLTAAQQDYSTLQVNFQNPAAQNLGQWHRAAYASLAPQTTGIGYLTPQQTYDFIQQETQQLYPTPGLGYLTPQQTYSIIQQEMQRLQANIQSNYGQNSSPTGSSGLSVLG